MLDPEQRSTPAVGAGADQEIIGQTIDSKATAEVGHSRQHRLAEEYARAGMPVFPCGPNKRPYTEHGFKDATTDLEQIGRWWRRWPDALVGIPTGAASGVFVIDLDRSKNGEPDGFDWRAEQEAMHGPLDAYVVTTPSGGEHLYFRCPDGVSIPTSAGVVAPNVDVRGDGGYVISAGNPGYEHDGAA